MPYKRRKPVSEESMENTRYAGHHTICETLREIYQLAKKMKEDCNFVSEAAINRCKIELDLKIIMDKARLATAMAKAMHEKLKRYKKKDENAK